MVSEEDESSSGGVGSILSSFGLNGLYGSGNKSNPVRILEISRSSITIHPVLLDTVIIDGQSDRLANHILRYSELAKIWTNFNDSPIEVWQDFELRSSRESFTIAESWALSELTNFIVGNDRYKGLVSTSFDEDTGLMEISVTCEWESLSFCLLKTIYDKLSTYYVIKAIEPQKATFDMVKAKSDSLRGVIDNLSRKIANIEDSRKAMMSATSQIIKNTYNRELQIAVLAYGKTLENLEIASFSLSHQTPYFQIIDESIVPLRPVRPSKAVYVFTGLIFGTFLGIISVIMMSLKSTIDKL